VVFFRDQTLTPAEQIAFAKRCGAIHDHSFMQGLDDHPEILEKEEGDTKAFGETWHTDQMLVPSRPRRRSSTPRRRQRSVATRCLPTLLGLRDAVRADEGRDRSREDLERRRPQEAAPAGWHGVHQREGR
jgi:hypothetical protein